MTVPRFLVSLIGAAVLVFTTGCGITAPSRSDGYAHFDAIRYHGMKRDTRISLGPRVLRFAARHMDDDPENEALLRAIDGVRVSTYRITAEMDREELIGSLADTASDLAADEWRTIARVRKQDKTVFVLLKEGDNSISGITVLTAGTEEFVFVNVMGDLSPEVLSRIAGEVPGGHTLAFATDRIGPTSEAR